MTSFIFDALNSFITQAVLADSDINNTSTGLNQNEREIKEIIVISVFSFLYFIVSLIHFILVMYYLLRDQSQTSDTPCDGIKKWFKNESIQIKIVYKKCKSFKGIVMIIINFLLLLSTWLCFIGDNLHSFGTLIENRRIASIVMLFAGLTGYRLIPLIKEKIKYLHEEYRNENQNDDDCINPPDETPNDDNNDDCIRCLKNIYKDMRKLNWELFNATIDILHLVPEIDGWFTNFTALLALTNDEACPKKYNAAFWIMYALVLVVTAFLPIIAAINLYCLCKKNTQQDNTENVQQENPEDVQQENPEDVQQDNPEDVQQDNPEDVQQDNPEDVQQENPEDVQQDNRQCCKKKKTLYLTILSFIMFFVTSFFLIGDNSQPLDCSKEDIIFKNKLRFSFVLVALFVYVFMLGLSAILCYYGKSSNTVVPLTNKNSETNHQQTNGQTTMLPSSPTRQGQ